MASSPSTTEPSIGEARENVAAASRLLAEKGLVFGTAGNVSERAGELVAITPTGAELGSLDAADIAIVDLYGALVDGPLAPTSEIELHLGVYRRHDAGGVVHTHSPMATALACVVEEVPCVHYGMLALGGAVPVAPYRTFGTPELAGVVVNALAERTAVLMANHGAVTRGTSVAQATELAELLEWACGVYWHARQVGEPKVLDADEQAAVITAALERGYGETKEAERE